VTTSQQPGVPSQWVSDKVDLDELFRDAKPVGDVDDWALPGFFASDDELRDFQHRLKVERASNLA
jgi:hypothetical protein